MQAEKEQNDNGDMSTDSKAECNANAKTTNSGKKKADWSGLQMTLMSKKKEVSEELKDCILLNNGSMLSLFMNPNLVERVRESQNTLELSTNMGTK